MFLYTFLVFIFLRSKALLGICETFELIVSKIQEERQ